MTPRCALALLVGLGWVQHAVADAPVGAVAPIDRPAVIVGQIVIWQSQVDERVASAKLGPAEITAVVDEMIDTELMVQHATKIGIDVDAAEVETAIGEIKTSNNLTDAQLDDALKLQGWTRDTYRGELRRQILRLRMANQVFRPRITITEEEITAATKVGNPDRTAARRELTDKRLADEAAKWLATQKKRVRIERRR